MSKYNIFKLVPDKKEALFDKFSECGLFQVSEQLVEGNTYRFFLSSNPQPVDIWWVDQYKTFLQQHLNIKNTAHFAVLVVESDSYIYAVSLGKSHFYLRNFSDQDFGINLAERIVKEDSISMKQSRRYGSKRSKEIVSYQAGSDLEFDSGESIHYLRADTLSPAQWGKNVSFGTSIQLTVPVDPSSLHTILQEIERELLNPSLFILPRIKRVDDPDQIAILDLELAQTISSPSQTLIQTTQSELYGVDFVFMDKKSYRLKYKKKQSPLLSEITMESVLSFADANNIDLNEGINELRVGVYDEHAKTFSCPLKELIDYVNPQRFLLHNGLWQQFNQDYVDHLTSQVEKIPFEIDPLRYSPDDHTKWLKETGNSPTTFYREKYFNFIQENRGFVNFDRDIETLKGYQIEKLDLYKDHVAYFVKFGEPREFAYVIDQSVNSLRNLRKHNFTIQLENHSETLEINSFCLWLITDRKSLLNDLNDFNSLIFKMKINEWYRECKNADIRPFVRIMYYS